VTEHTKTSSLFSGTHMWIALAVSAIVFICAIAVSTGFGTLPSDEGYLEAVQANQLAVTGDFVIYGGQKGNGVTSPLWMLMLYGPAKAGASLPSAMHILGLLMGMLSVLFIGLAIKNKVSAIIGWLVITVFMLSPPVLWAVLSGTSSVLVLPLVAALTATMVMPLFDDDKLQGLMLFFLIALLALARPEAWFLCVFIPFIPQKWSNTSALMRGLATAAGLFAGLMTRSAVLGSLDDGALTMLFGGQGLAGVFTLKELGWGEVLMSLTVHPIINLIESTSVAATMLIPTAAAVVIVLGIVRPSKDKESFPGMLLLLTVILPVVAYGMFAGETGSGEGMSHMLFILPVWTVAGAWALHLIPGGSIAPRKMMIWIALGSILLVASLAYSGQGLGEYWASVYQNQWRQVFTLSGILLVAAVLMALAASKREAVGTPLLAIAIVATMALAIPTMVTASGDAEDFLKLEDLSESMTLLVKRHDVVGVYDSGYALYLRPRNTMDLSGRTMDVFRDSITIYKRDHKKQFRSVSQQAIGKDVKWVICRADTSCNALKMNSDWQYSLKSGPFNLYKYILRTKKYPEVPGNKRPPQGGRQQPPPGFKMPQMQR